MLTFSQFPYQRPSSEDLEQRYTHHSALLAKAVTVAEAYAQLIELDYLQRLFANCATISEAGNTADSRDEFYAEEEAFFNQAKPRFQLLLQKKTEAIEACTVKDALRPLLGDEFFDSAAMQRRTVNPGVLELMRRENDVSQRYSALMSQLTVTHEGEVHTLPMLAKKADSPSRAQRRTYALLTEQALLGVADELDDIFEELMHIRTDIALGTGFQNYTDYCLCKHGRTSYGRAELTQFAHSVEQHVVPVVSALFAQQAERLGHPVLNYDEATLFPGRQVQIEKDLLSSYNNIFTQLSPETKVFFDELTEREFFDLSLREGKTTGAYSNYLPLCGMPFIFQTYNSTEGAVQTFAHECGHGLNSFLHRGEPLLDVCASSSDISEIHSKSMEFFVWPHIHEIIPSKHLPGYQYRQLRDALAFIAYGTAIDQFQTAVYDNPSISPAQRLALWQELEQRFLPWKQYEEGGFYSQGRAWQRQIHVMKWPFYYIDYVLAEVCALQFWALDCDDHQKAWDAYLRLIKNTGRYSFVDLVRSAGLLTPFDEGILPFICKKASEFIQQLDI